MIKQKLVNDVAFKNVGCAIEVHKQSGVGLPESVSQSCLPEELRSNNLSIQSKLSIPVLYKRKDLGGQLKPGVLVGNLILTGLKDFGEMLTLCTAQLLSFLKLAAKPKRLLINFHTENIVGQMLPWVTEEFTGLPLS